jgi:hypothetical protein
MPRDAGLSNFFEETETAGISSVTLNHRMETVGFELIIGFGWVDLG